MRGLFITGTDTGVGKTQVAAALARLLVDQGVHVRPRKPVESGCIQTKDGLVPEDALTLKTAARSTDSVKMICPYQFQPAISPQRAAEQSGVQLSLNDLQQACLNGVNHDDDFLLVEAAGGFFSPMAHKLRCVALAQPLNLPVLLVVADRLGCINHALLTTQAIEQAGLELVAVVMNQVAVNDDSGMNNLEDLKNWLDRDVIALHRQQNVKTVWENLAHELDGLAQLVHLSEAGRE
jgi:dethiobiotin synthetase